MEDERPEIWVQDVKTQSNSEPDPDPDQRVVPLTYQHARQSQNPEDARNPSQDERHPHKRGSQERNKRKSAGELNEMTSVHESSFRQSLKIKCICA